jgi:hypothetical protein
VLDVMFVKEEDGTFSGFDARKLSNDDVGRVRCLRGRFLRLRVNTGSGRGAPDRHDPAAPRARRAAREGAF